MTITLTFRQGTNPDVAQVQVQNKLSLAVPLLPQEVQQRGIRVAKSTKNFLVIVAFVSTDGSMTAADLQDFVASTVQDPISRTPGVGDFQVFGSQYAMRIWLDPAKLNNVRLTPMDVSNAIAAQNVQVASGEIGGLPAVDGQQINATVIGPSRLSTPEEFGQILLRVDAGGGQIRLKDVAEIKLDGENFAISARYNGQPTSGIAVRLASGANALTTVEAVRATMERIKPTFPHGLEVVYPFDTAPFVEISIHEVVKTLFEAVLLVFCVMYLFLQNFRATLIPTIAVPVVLLGTFAMLAACGFSINTLTMLGMVLAIGLLVDDAIVVVENVERVMSEEGLSPKEATRKSMSQITGALVGIGLVLSAVFVPMAFFGGSTGVIYRQFSITIVSAMALSVVVALIFTPSLCATMLQPIPKGHHESARGFFGWFNRTFRWGTNRYEGTVHYILRRRGRFLVIYLAIIAAMAVLFKRLPTSFLPDEDQGIVFAQVTTPPGSPLGSTEKVLDKIREYMLTREKNNVQSVMTVAGFSLGGRGQNAGIAFIRLKDWDQRPGKANRVQAIAGRAMRHFMTFREALAFAFAPPAVIELGNATGFDFQLIDEAGVGHEKLMEARNQLLGMAAKSSNLALVRPNGLNDEPQYRIKIDHEKAGVLGVSVADINNTLSAAWGAAYINDFEDRGRIKRVFLQGQPSSRMQPDDFGKWYVRNAAGKMVPFSAFASGEWTYGSPRLERFNGHPSMQIFGQAVPGKSSGVAMKEMEDLARKMPKGVGFEWSGLSYEERAAGAQAGSLYVISLLVVFLCLAALYESWSIPSSVMMSVPLGILGAVVATWGRGLSNDVFLQVGLLTIVGLSAKNAILIVEFAKTNFDRGMGLMESALLASRQRLRPILMTSFAFMLGVLPLALSTGAGSGGHNAIGTGVIGGTFSATVFGILFIPLFFLVVLRLFRVKPRSPVAREPQNHSDGLEV
ncbi:MAG: efflux RND transporter permease subunit, partial [Terrimicrobiaceae bacterium]